MDRLFGKFVKRHTESREQGRGQSIDGGEFGGQVQPGFPAPVNLGRRTVGIDDPVLLDTELVIEVQFDRTVHARCALRQNFHYEIGSPLYILAGQDVSTSLRDLEIRLHYIDVGKHHIEGSSKDFPQLMAVHEMPEASTEAD